LGKRRLLVLGPSFRRRRTGEVLSALERYDGIFFRVARKYLDRARDVDVVVMGDDLVLVDGGAPLPYRVPVGDVWGGLSFSREELEAARRKNEEFLRRRLRGGRYSEVFIAMGKRHAEALPDLSDYGVRVIFPASGGPGPKARALKEWLTGEKVCEG